MPRKPVVEEETEFDPEALKEAFCSFVDEVMSRLGAAEDADDEAEEEGEEAEEGEEEQEYDPAELSKMKLPALKKLAMEAGYSKEDLADVTAKDIIDALTSSDDDGEEEEEAESEEAEGEEEEGEGYDVDELKEMSLGDLRKLAKENGWSVADYKGMSQEELAEALAGGDDEEEEVDEEEEGSDEESYTEDDLNAMGLTDLKTLAKEYGVRVKVGMKKPALIKAIMAAAE